MNIIKIPVGLLNANCYILEKENKLLIIDPGDEYEKIKENINGKEILKILITHHHEDHIGALKYFDQDLIKVEICSKCYAAITSDFINDYYLADNRCPRCLSKIESLED